MAASSLLALIDDIASLLDDVAAMTKVAARQGAAAADDVAAMTQLAARKAAGAGRAFPVLRGRRKITARRPALQG